MTAREIANAGLFLVDTEASAPTPHSGVMTEFGVVDFATRDWFHGHLYDFHPHPQIPALPIPEDPRPGFTTSLTPRQDVGSAVDVFTALTRWLDSHRPPSGRFTMVSDNPAYDFMWVAMGFDEAGLPNPFGHSARRIGDLAAGLSGDWRRTSAWKRLRRTVHDHNPVNDSLGNAEALHAILVEHGQIEPVDGTCSSAGPHHT